MWIWNTLRRKNKSSRNSPVVISEPSGRLVAAMTRILVDRGRASPTGVISPCSIARSSLTWSPGATSPISSRRTVPPAASSSRPLRSWTAPVNDPFKCPKSSRSTRLGLRAARQIGKNGPPLPAAVAVNRPGDELLAGSALPGNQHRDVGRRDKRVLLNRSCMAGDEPMSASGCPAQGVGPASGPRRFSRARLTTATA